MAPITAPVGNGASYVHIQHEALGSVQRNSRVNRGIRHVSNGCGKHARQGSSNSLRLLSVLQSLLLAILPLLLSGLPIWLRRPVCSGIQCRFRLWPPLLPLWLRSRDRWSGSGRQIQPVRMRRIAHGQDRRQARPRHISTSYAERANLTMRMLLQTTATEGMRRVLTLTLLIGCLSGCAAQNDPCNGKDTYVGIPADVQQCGRL